MFNPTMGDEMTHPERNGGAELLPCPFCGSKDIRHWDAIHFETFCHDCGAATRPIEKTDDSDADHEASAQIWNTRAAREAEGERGEDWPFDATLVAEKIMSQLGVSVAEGSREKGVDSRRDRIAFYIGRAMDAHRNGKPVPTMSGAMDDFDASDSGPKGVEAEVGVLVKCTNCGRTKQPVGRDARCGGYCHGTECEGYWQDPAPGDLWPGETREQFGYGGTPRAAEELPSKTQGAPGGLEAIARWIEAGCFNADSMSVRRIMAENVRAFLPASLPGATAAADADWQAVASQLAENLRDYINAEISSDEAAIALRMFDAALADQNTSAEGAK